MVILPFHNGAKHRDLAPHNEAMWTEWANELSPSAFLVWLAGQVSDDMLAHRSPVDTVSKLISSVDASIRPSQLQAERYLRRGWVYAWQMKRVIRIFRHLIRLKLHWCETTKV